MMSIEYNIIYSELRFSPYTQNIKLWLTLSSELGTVTIEASDLHSNLPINYRSSIKFKELIKKLSLSKKLQCLRLKNVVNSC